MYIVIGSDLAPTQSNIELFRKDDVIELLGEELYELWNSADFRILNLEVPLTDQKDPISKCGLNLIAPKSSINGIKALNPSLLTLANNHILDQGRQGLSSTDELLSKNLIPFVGAGNDLDKASKPFIFEREKIKIGVYACAEHEFSIATENTPGANPFDPLESLDHIAALRAECDYVIVLYHGGKEHYRYPSPYLQRVCRKMIKKGADLVVCQHSHCIGCYEEYLGSTIVYGQGNFIFDYSESEFWQTSLLAKISIDDGIHIGYIPIEKVGNVIRLAKGKTAEDILFGFHKRSGEILEDGFVERQYCSFAAENYSSYIRRFAGYGKWMSRIDNRLFSGMLSRRKYNKKQLLAMQNYIECEAHRELLLTGLRIKGIQNE